MTKIVWEPIDIIPGVMFKWDGMTFMVCMVNDTKATFLGYIAVSFSAGTPTSLTCTLYPTATSLADVLNELQATEVV